MKGNVSISLNNIKLEASFVEKDLGLMVTPNLSWSGNCDRRTQKATRAFFHLKRNVFSICSWTNKLHSYAGYVVSIFTYCANAWLRNKTNFIKFKIAIEMASSCILSSIHEYKERLLKLKLQPSSLC